MRRTGCDLLEHFLSFPLSIRLGQSHVECAQKRSQTYLCFTRCKSDAYHLGLSDVNLGHQPFVIPLERAQDRKLKLVFLQYFLDLDVVVLAWVAICPLQEIETSGTGGNSSDQLYDTYGFLDGTLEKRQRKCSRAGGSKSLLVHWLIGNFDTLGRAVCVFIVRVC